MAGAISTPLAYRVGIALILVAGTTAAGLAYRDALLGARAQAAAEFGRRATLQHAVTREVIGRYSEALFGLASVFTVNAEVSREEFVQDTTRLEPHVSGAQAFEWVPVVSESDRAAFELARRRDYRQRGFEIIDFDGDAHPHRAPSRSTHYPVAYIHPLRGNEIALGFDLIAGPTQAYLERARATRQMVVTSQVQLVQDKPGDLGVIMVWPVYRSRGTVVPGPAAGGDRANGGEFIGFLQCVFRVHGLLETVSAAPQDRGLEMLFVDDSEADPARRILFYRPAAGDTAPPPATVGEFRRGAPFVKDLPLTVGQRDWHVLYRPGPGSAIGPLVTAPFVRASAILAVTVLLAGLIRVVGRRTALIRHEVAQRTTELSESRRQYSSLLHALPGIAYRGTYGERLKLTFVSEGTLQLTGWTADEFVSGAIHSRDIIHPDDTARVRAETRAALTAHRDLELEYRIRTRAGDEKWVLSRGRGIYSADGVLRGIEGLIIDVTRGKRAEFERLAIERKLLETQKLESLGLLAGGIAHDFNNLLSAILGNANLARMGLPAKSSVDPQLRAIESAAMRAAELCRQMLAYAGKGRFVVETVNLSALVEDLLPLLRVSIGPGVSLHLELPRELAPVRVDATQVRQIVMNLVMNAVDALATRRGAITIETGETEVDRALLARCVTGTTLPAGRYVHLAVTDSGSGMAPDVIQKIFDPFFTTKFAGRGLGLAAVLGIVRGHNGALLVQSEIDHGSSFRLFLPAASAGPASTANAAPALRPARGHSGDVLVVDDEDAVRSVLVAIMQALGFNPRGAVNGHEALNLFRENPGRWTLVVIDLLMPGMTGEETLKAMRVLKPDLKALLISGYDESGTLGRLQANGARVAFLAKPFRHEVLEDKLRDLQV
ncbi:MAG TPA: CHASE domain-containing protein [Opitutaceae bacterium]|nr:CHASE domain-containing protein [Opitutaceae bacterium]